MWYSVRCKCGMLQMVYKGGTHLTSVEHTMSAHSKLNAHIKLLPSFEHTLHIRVVFFQAEIVMNNK